MEVRDHLYYTKDHEWVEIREGRAYVGITDYAQHSLGDIVFLELPDADADYVAQERLGVIESVKAVADLHSPISGRVIEVNLDLEGSPEVLNRNPYQAWIAVLELRNTDELAGLLSADEYRELLRKA